MEGLVTSINIKMWELSVIWLIGSSIKCEGWILYWKHCPYVELCPFFCQYFIPLYPAFLKSRLSIEIMSTFNTLSLTLLISLNTTMSWNYLKTLVISILPLLILMLFVIFLSCQLPRTQHQPYYYLS